MHELPGPTHHEHYVGRQIVYKKIKSDFSLVEFLQTLEILIIMILILTKKMLQIEQNKFLINK